jgi:hypothetical protein
MIIIINPSCQCSLKNETDAPSNKARLNLP